MIKRVSCILTGIYISVFANAQVTLHEQVTIGANNNDMVFYQMKCSETTTSSNSDWHFAVSVRPSVFPSNTLQGTSVRINEAIGVKVFQIPSFTADSFNVVVDTANYSQWQQLHDSDSLLDLGALNSGLNINVFNYGWGTYNGPPNHDVAGTKVYLYILPDGTAGKFYVEQLDKDTAWDLKFASIDNQNIQTVHIGKAAYSGKNFVYLNLKTTVVHDKEPLSEDWDILFTKYTSVEAATNSVSPQVGVLLNKGVTAAECLGVDQAITSPTTSYTSDMSTIGWEWKYFDIQNNTYIVDDSIVYFVKNRTGEEYKLFFTQYSGDNTGIFSFTTQQNCLSSSMQMSGLPQFTVFPNPAKSSVNISGFSTADISVYDFNGNLLYQYMNVNSTLALNTGHLASGFYLVKVSSQQGVGVHKLSVIH